MENEPSIGLILDRNIFQKSPLAVEADPDPLDRGGIARTPTQRALEGCDDILILYVTMAPMDARMNPNSHGTTSTVSYALKCST